MKLIKVSHEIWEQDVSGKPVKGIITSPETMRESLLQGIYAQIERAGRVCYKSEDKIGKQDPKIFVDRMIKSGHLSVLEHGTVYLTIPCSDWTNYVEFTWGYGSNPYVEYDDSECDWEKGKGNVYITTNYRVIVENEWQNDLENYLCLPTEFHARRATVCFTTDIGVSREANRHRKNSISEESTRYCNYSKEKFGSNISFILPEGISDADLSGKVDFMMQNRIAVDNQGNHFLPELKVEQWTAIDWFIWALSSAELGYMKLIENGWTAQQARNVLPLDTKTTLVHTAFISDWCHFFDLRVKGTTGAPHPQMLEVMKPVYDEFVKRYGIA